MLGGNSFEATVTLAGTYGEAAKVGAVVAAVGR